MGFFRRSMRWLVRGVLLLVIGVLGLIAAVLVGISSDAGNERIRQEILKAAAPSFPEGELAIGRVDTNLLGHFDLFDVEIRVAPFCSVSFFTVEVQFRSNYYHDHILPGRRPGFRSSDNPLKVGLSRHRYNS